jgi:hypothetical protein
MGGADIMSRFVVFKVPWHLLGKGLYMLWCSSDELLHEQMEIECEQMRVEYELEQDLQREQELDWEEPMPSEFPSEVVCVSAIMDWDAYRLLT